MQMVKAVTNRHPTFLKEAYKLDGVVDLVNDERWISHGDRFIRFDGLSFVVCIKADRIKMLGLPHGYRCSALR